MGICEKGRIIRERERKRGREGEREEEIEGGRERERERKREREGEREEERERECENAFPCGDVENENVIERRRESEYKNLMDVSWLTLVQSKI